MSNVVTARISDETLALVDRIVRERGRTRSWFVAEAVRRAAEAQAEFDAFIQEGIDAIERGDVVPHEEVMAHLDQRIAELQAKCGA